MNNADIMLKAYGACAVLLERQKSIAKEHVERRKKLIHLMEQVNKAETTGQPDLPGVNGGNGSLPQDLADLLENPLHGL